jgi:ankyrin repeat protein
VSELTSPIWVVRVKDVLKMTTLEPHIKIKEAGMLHEWKPGDAQKVIFVSHQWISWDGSPDPSMKQFGVLQRWLQSVMSGKIKAFEADFMIQLLFQKSVAMDVVQFRQDLEDAVIWYDYFSVPQLSKSYDPDGAKELMNAVNSIPAFVEFSAYFVVLCPPVRHEGHGGICDKHTWMSRGWCRVEGQARELACSSGPLIVVSSDTSCQLMLPLDVMRLSVGEGQYTCCANNHNMNGTQIPCDKLKVAKIMKLMIQGKIKALKEDGNMEDARWMLARRPSLFRGLPNMEDCQPQDGSLPDFMSEYGFESINENAATGLTPLRFAAIQGSCDVVEALLERNVDINAVIKDDMPDMFHWKGDTVLHSCAMFNEDPAVTQLLVEAGANPSARNSIGNPPFYMAIAGARLALVQWYVKQGLANVNDRNDNGLAPLGQCCLWGGSEVGSYLIENGAEVNITDKGGVTPLHLTVISNSLELAKKILDAKANVNHTMQPETRFFSFLFSVCNGLRMMGSTSEVVHIFGQGRNSTPLLFCANFGRPEMAALFLQYQADHTIRNNNGFTPLELAKARGFDEVVEVLMS